MTSSEILAIIGRSQAQLLKDALVSNCETYPEAIIALQDGSNWRAWTENNVYFPLTGPCEDWVFSVPRNPTLSNGEST